MEGSHWLYSVLKDWPSSYEIILRSPMEYVKKKKKASKNGDISFGWLRMDDQGPNVLSYFSQNKLNKVSSTLFPLSPGTPELQTKTPPPSVKLSD